jgi:phosphate-selective porin OprO/OprP
MNDRYLSARPSSSQGEEELMISRSTAERVCLVAAVLGGLIFVQPGTASARDIAEILQDNGTITRDEFKEASRTQTKPFMTYKEGLGFVFSTPDSRFTLAVGGYVQFRYTLNDIDENYTNPSRGSGDNQTFDVPRARIWWRGNAFTPRLFYKLEIDVATTSGGDTLRDAELGYQLIEDEYLNVKVGQFKTFYSRQEMTSDSKLEFVDRALATNNFRYERAKGIALYGAPMNSLIEYYGGVFNTTGRNGPLNPSDDFLYLTRFVVNPLGPIPYSEGDFASTPTPLFSIGMSYSYERTPASTFTTAATTGPSPTDPDTTIITANGSVQNRVPYQGMIQPFYNKLQNPNQLTVGIQNMEVDFAARWIGIDVQAEYFLGFNNTAFVANTPPAPYALPPGNFNSHGYYAQAGYFIIPKKLQIAGRYSELTPNEKAKVKYGDGDVETASQDELLGAISWYFSEHNLKIQTDFGQVNNNGLKDTAGNIENRHDLRWRVQAQLIF